MIISCIRKFVSRVRSFLNSSEAKELNYQKEIWKKLFNDRISKDEFACELQEHLDELILLTDKMVLRSFIAGIALGALLGSGFGKIGWL